MDLLKFAVIFSAIHCSYAQRNVPDTDYFSTGQEELKRALDVRFNGNVAKNVILFIGDGLGISTITAARIHKGQRKGNSGEEEKMTWEDFPHAGFIKTYSHDKTTPDSGSTATALMCGEKSNFATIGLSAKAQALNCSSQAGNELDSIAKWSMDEGKSVGLVTTTRITHATPAAAYAHTVLRLWESDGDKATPPFIAAPECAADIAKQLIDDNPDITVLLGGGRNRFLPKDTPDPEYGSAKNGTRLDGRNLIQEWQAKHGNRAKYVWNKEQFDQVNPRTTSKLLGLFEPSHMQYEAVREATDGAGEPSLQNMTKKAIEILKKDRQGYFLMVEGGRIDQGHHAGIARLALEDTIAFDDAIQTALTLTDRKDTLIVVTADHSHPFTISGYPNRGDDILGIADDVFGSVRSLDGKPWMTLSYTNGPGATVNQPRADLKGITKAQYESYTFKQPALVPMEQDTHAGEDVGIFATGPMAHLFHTTHEQHYVAHAMAYASCVGPNKEHCCQEWVLRACHRRVFRGRRNPFIKRILNCVEKTNQFMYRG